VLSHLLAAIAPPCCAGCLSPLAGAGDVVCGECRRALPWLRTPLCPRCALPLPGRGAHDCPAAGHAFSVAWAPMAYEGVARELVRTLKFAGGRPLAGVLAAQLAAGMPAALRAGATVVAAPSHPARVRARGYDQAVLLARELARRTGLPVARGLLRRGGPATRQLGAPRTTRLGEGRIVVAVRGAAPPRALLVDDVHTTGATLSACAAALRAAGTAEVAAVTWARAL
jgi:predicted amidophosphoribosyltransferase